ncbi:hypothetical protein FK220_017620 [Flavobacteriaceae bacterium TP-CH-4]|uniref:Uncharacterized protein n=1 Tax=Pelagihabitans pacificus TaxID=2696054 RepID=A0A967AVJ3_9FLAO|nr:DUF6503 family protein [Pelagihabitans pacificus]NHF61176.1 hypothetical protein [Pelagihabitans pacificus]
MKKILMLMVLGIFVSCKEAPKEVPPAVVSGKPDTKAAKNAYPEALERVFEAHGGLENWKKKRTLVYDLPKPTGIETHTTDLYSRKDRITIDDVMMGFDGKDVWLLDGKEAYGGDPIFYHNLMFYFYAMPFVLADDGINYAETEPLQFEGVSYPGIRITYDTGVGTSPKDEYYIHYHPQNYQMTWLGYTVTYRTGEKSDNVKWIRYSDWMEVEDLVLPKTLTWHAYEGRDIKEAKNSYTFEEVSLSEAALPDSFYAVPENAKVVTK